MKISGIIPARIGSTRLFEKPLQLINGKSLIQRVYENTIKCTHLDNVIVATDSEKILNHVESFNGKVIMTSKNHRNGTERVAEVVEKIKADVVVNIQGDEPFIRPDMIEKLIKPYFKGFKGLATLKVKIDKKEDINSTSVVKVVCDKNDNALYFSRLPIPFNRDGDFIPHYYKHIGLYAYDEYSLKKIINTESVQIEKAEKLEQLRALYSGLKIKVLETEYDGVEINTPEDLKKAYNYFK
ncbi:MAG: 3-deoxy-manno-octulosonate cytidylyltransferase [Candidatus Muiribacteriota bacterium]